MRRASTVRIIESDSDALSKPSGTPSSAFKPQQHVSSSPSPSSSGAAATAFASLGSFLSSGTFESPLESRRAPSGEQQHGRGGVAAVSSLRQPSPQVSSSSSSRPKPSIGQQVEVSDVSALVSLIAQRHAVIKDREKLLALSDVAAKMLTEGPLLPRARDNIALSNKREVLLEELAEHRMNVQNLQHLARVANEEHERLLSVNDSLLAMVKRKDDLHAQTTQQFYIAGTMDAEANETLMRLEGRRRTLLGFAGAMRRDVEKILGGAAASKTTAAPSGTRDVKLKSVAASQQSPHTAKEHRLGRGTMRGDGWSTTVDDSGNRRRLPTASPSPSPTSPPKATSVVTPARGGQQQQPQGGGTTDDVERRLFDLRMTGHELLREMDAVIAKALDAGSDVVGGVDGAMRTAQELRSVLTEPTDGRGSLWLFSACTKPTCLVAREKLRKLMPAATPLQRSPVRSSSSPAL